MESRIPVPTDNIFKFYALFGLLLFVFACGAVLYTTQTTNQLVFSTYVESEILKDISEPSAAEKAQLEMLEKQLEIGVQNKDFYMNMLALLAGFSFWLAVYGFVCWHREIQPVADQMAKTQLGLARLQLVALRADLKSKGVGGGHAVVAL